jgi:hypothetical protein
MRARVEAWASAIVMRTQVTGYICVSSIIHLTELWIRHCMSMVLFARCIIHIKYILYYFLVKYPRADDYSTHSKIVLDKGCSLIK